MVNLWLNLGTFIVSFAYITANLRADFPNHDTLKEDKRRITYIDVLAKGLKTHKWEKEENVCLNRMLMTLENAKNSTLWAVWILDSMQLPVGQLYGSMNHLGHYEQCFNHPWTNFEIDTQYCTATVTLTWASKRYTGNVDAGDTTTSYLQTYTKKGRDLSKMKWGVCLPTKCSTQSVSKILGVVLQATHLGSLAGTADISTEYCKTSSSIPYSPGFYIFLFTVLSLMVTTIFSTYRVQNKRDTDTTSFGSGLIKCFCLKRNMSSLTKVRKDEIFFMNGLRILIAVIVIGTHNFAFLYGHMSFNGLYLDSLLDAAAPIIIHIDIGLDTCLAMSGLLLMRSMMDDSRKPFKLIWKRYVRFVGGLSIVLFYVAAVSHYVGDGPVWTEVIKDQEMCASHGWLNILMLSNYIGANNMCYPISYYVACDYQLTILGVILFYVYLKNRRIGIYVFATVFFLSMLSPAVVTYWNRLPPLVFHGIESIRELRDNVVFTSVYMQAHHRAGGFLVGMLAGYLMSIYKSTEYRKVLPKKWSCIVIVLCIMMKLSILRIGNFFYERHEPILSTIFLTFNKVTWALSSCIIIAIFEYGTLPLLQFATAWRPLVPMSRLTYGVYLIHYTVLQRNFYSMYTPARFDIFEKVTSTLGAITVIFCLSLGLWLLVEAPVVNIANMLFDTKSRDKQKMVDYNGNNTRSQQSDGRWKEKKMS